VLQGVSCTCLLLFTAYCGIPSALSWQTLRIREVRGIWTPSQSETSQPGTGFARCMLALPRGGERAAVLASRLYDMSGQVGRERRHGPWAMDGGRSWETDRISPDDARKGLSGLKASEYMLHHHHQGLGRPFPDSTQLRRHASAAGRHAPLDARPWSSAMPLTCCLHCRSSAV
jgi:hypothetical protein